jgi:hypothetical protein
MFSNEEFAVVYSLKGVLGGLSPDFERLSGYIRRPLWGEFV